MTLQIWLMVGMLILCFISAIDWWLRGDYYNSVAFVMWGLADIAIALRTWSY